MATFARSVSTLELTASGKRKLAAMEKAALVGLENGLIETAKEFKRFLEKYSPGPVQEARLLSQGVVKAEVGRSKAAGRRTFRKGEEMVGVPTGGRFRRESPMLSLRDAIRESPITATASGTKVTVTTARASELNKRTGFSWRTRSRGTQGPTLPFNKRYIQALEDGGVWEVRRRTSRLLNPQPGVFAARMIKTLQPWGMFKKAKAAVRSKARLLVDTAVQKELRKIK